MPKSTRRPAAYHDPVDYLSLAEVETIARRAHEGQVDKNGHPYSEHLAAVAHGVAARGGSDEQVAAGWLHDAIEDDALSREWLAEAALSGATKAIVDALTKRPGESLEVYTARILATPGALLVKQADLAHNSNPARLASLDDVTAARLAEKYRRTRELLGLAED
ncbi:HD domain-containing protein [Kitasatospora hibisci]|uniref:HD domain-containing protein n=1 Tax=Kitasatospora hibisci TaxID=3369522 RepID=UPI0037553633